MVFRIAFVTRGETKTPFETTAYSLSHQVGTNFDLKQRRPSKLYSEFNLDREMAMARLAIKLPLLETSSSPFCDSGTVPSVASFAPCSASFLRASKTRRSAVPFGASVLLKTSSRY